MKPRTQISPQNRLLQNSLWDLHGTPDKTILFVIGILTVFGTIMVYSASFITIRDEPFFFFVRHIIFTLIGIVCAAIAYSINYKLYPKLIVPGILVSIALLILVLIPGTPFANDALSITQGARRWLDFGFFDFQPSELTKLIFVIYLAAWSSKQKTILRLDNNILKDHINKELFPFLAILGLISGLIMLQPDLGTTGLIGATALSVYILSGRDKIHTLGASSIVILMLALGVTAAFLEDYRYKRVVTYVEFIETGVVKDPYGDGFQLQQMLTAVGSGGIFGVGFGESGQKYGYLEGTAHTDNIYAIIAEEFGFVGSVAIAAAYLYFLIYTLNIAARVPDRFGKLLVSGIVIWLTLQAYIHISANVGLIPLKGMPLPFLSYGGSSSIINLVAVGIILNIARYARQVDRR